MMVDVKLEPQGPALISETSTVPRGEHDHWQLAGPDGPVAGLDMRRLALIWWTKRVSLKRAALYLPEALVDYVDSARAMEVGGPMLTGRDR